MTKSAFWISSLFLLCALSVVAGPPNIDTTLEAQRDLVAERPYDASVHNDLGNLLTWVERWDEAAASYQRAIELDPTDPAARFNLALLDGQQGRLGQAESGLLQVIEMSPGHGRAYYQLGTIYADKGDRNKAMEAYARAFAADPTLTFASNNPHIVENKYRMEAMLMSQRYENSTATQQPRVYGDPDRIRKLMILEEEREAAAAEAAEAAAEAAVAEEQAARGDDEGTHEQMLEDDDDDISSAYGGGLEDDDDDTRVIGTASSSPRVLTQDSIDSGRNSATPTRTRRRPSGVGAGSSYRPPSSSGNSVQRGGVTRSEGSSRRVGSGNTQSEGSASEGSAGNRGSEVRRPSTRPRRVGRVGYRTGTASTGRLDLELLPAPDRGGEEPVVLATKR